VPYRFSCRKGGRSKMGPGVAWSYVCHVAGLCIYRIIG